MPRVTLSPEIKIAITAMTPKDKDKLLLRLVAKDDKLVEQLEFKLLEGSATTEERRDRISELIQSNLQEYQGKRFYPGGLTRALRKTSGQITRHVQVTKDKYGEISLNLELLLTAFRVFGHQLPTIRSRKTDSLYQYIVKKAQRILTLIERMHEDYQLDFEENLEKMREEIMQHRLMHQVAVELDFQ